MKLLGERANKEHAARVIIEFTSEEARELLGNHSDDDMAHLPITVSGDLLRSAIMDASATPDGQPEEEHDTSGHHRFRALDTATRARWPMKKNWVVPLAYYSAGLATWFVVDRYDPRSPEPVKAKTITAVCNMVEDVYKKHDFGDSSLAFQCTVDDMRKYLEDRGEK